MPPPLPIVDLRSGVLGEPTSVRKVSDLTTLYQGAASDDDRVVYRTYGCGGEDTEQPNLLYATTVIESGNVHGEPFMTRGHFHLKPERGEWMLTLSGSGVLVLMDRAGTAWTEPMREGSIHQIDGRHAHRVANTGDEPLAFVVVWLSDCGHDYASVRNNPGPMRAALWRALS